MALSLRVRPEKSPNFYLGGTVRVGQKQVRIREHSLGISDEAKAKVLARRIETRLENDLIYNIKEDPRDKITLREAHNKWQRIRNPDRSMRSRAKAVLEFFGPDMLLKDFTELDWARLKAERLNGMASSSVQAYTTIIRGMFLESGFGSPPVMKFTRKNKFRDKHLSLYYANKLIDCYSEAARGPAIVARYGGLRAGEIARLQKWDVIWSTKEIVVRDPKNGHDRRVPMHAKVEAVIRSGCDSSKTDFVFEKEPGVPWPYARGEGNNPFYKSHAVACEKAGVKDFSFHDWRHHWAFSFVKHNPNVRDLAEAGGWRDLKILMRYLSPNKKHIRGAIISM